MLVSCWPPPCLNEKKGFMPNPMMYTTDKNVKMSGAPKPWIRTDLSHTRTMVKYLERNLRVYNADTCGDDTTIFAFEDGKCYKLDYAWWFEYDDEEEGLDLKDEYCIREISIDKVPTWMRKYRDWM